MLSQLEATSNKFRMTRKGNPHANADLHLPMRNLLQCSQLYYSHSRSGPASLFRTSENGNEGGEELVLF